MDKKGLREQIVESVDRGEAYTRHILNVQTVGELSFCYALFLSIFKAITGPSVKTLAYLLANYSKEEPIIINKFVKQRIMEAVGARSIGTVANSLNELCGVGILCKNNETNGVYYLNPSYALLQGSEERARVIVEIGMSQPTSLLP